MRITLTELHLDPPHPLQVSFSSACGDGRGQWLGPLPQVAQDYEVELSLEDEFHWNANISAAAQGPARLHWQRGALQVSGQLLQVEADGAAALAVDRSIILLSLQGGPACTPQCVKLRARQVSLRPIDL
nr:hypothetical protein FFPRI1PSEUD_26140 [Pseudomonas sp. FFPRI_1]